MDYNESLVKSNVAGALIKFAIPVMLANILQVVYSATDLLILGNFATTADVSGATISSQIMMLVTLGLSGISSGVMVSLGQFSGAKNEKNIAGTIGTSILLFAAISAVLTIPMLIFNNPIISIMQTPPDAVDPARGYLFICSIGIIFILGYNVSGSIFRGLGNSTLPLYFAAVSCVINIALDLLFVKSFGLGASGAALATVIAQGCSLMFALVYIKLRGLGFSFSRSDIRFRWMYVRRILEIGAPISLQEVLVTLSFLIITGVVNRMGVVASASVGIVEKLMGIFMMPTMAMASAVAAMSAHNIGAGELRRAEKCMWTGALISIAAAVPICIFCVFRGILPVSVFTRDPEVAYNASLYIKTYIFDCLGVSLVFIINGFFSSCGHSVFAMAHSLFVTFLIRVPVVVFVARIEGITLLPIGLAAPLSSFVSAIVCVIYFFYIRKKGDYAAAQIADV